MPSSSREERENIPKIEKITEEIKYRNGPTKFAGQLQNNEKVRIIKKEGKKISSAEGIASYYSREEGFKTTATGSPFCDNLSTVAVNDRLGYKLPCVVKITNLENGEDIEAVANDHGPYVFNKKGKAIRNGLGHTPHKDRIIDLSPLLAKRLGFKKLGLARVRVDYICPLIIK